VPFELPKVVCTHRPTSICEVSFHKGGAVDGSGPRRRVLLFIKCLDLGGAERLVVDLVAHHDRQSFDYEVAYVLKGHDGLVPEIEASGVKVHCLGSRGNWDLSWLPRYRRLLMEGQFDIVHSHLPLSSALGRLVTLTLPTSRRPVLVYTEHCLWDWHPSAVRFLNRVTIGKEKAVLAVSDVVRDGLAEPVRDRAEVVVHGIDFAVWRCTDEERDEIRREVRQELGVADDEVLVLTVANLRKQKGYEVLLAAARMLLDFGAPIRFAAVGIGPIREELETERRRLGLGDRFVFLGQRDDVMRLMAGSDVFALSSHYEGLPVVLMEATTLGMPIVVTRVGEIPNMIENGVDGLVVEPGDPKSFAEALVRVVEDKELRVSLGRNARIKSTRFDIRAAAARIELIYSDLLEERASA